MRHTGLSGRALTCTMACVFSSKTVTMDGERVVLDIPRDRHGQFDPTLIPPESGTCRQA